MQRFKHDSSSYFLDQSERDVPCRVRFAGEDSLMHLSKWGGEASLVFAPGGEHEGKIEVRGNEILLKPEVTPKAYHVFRRLDGERFEYDVILIKEPETNRIDIALDFPDGLEFFRQPSFDKLLGSPYRCSAEVIDSYAVYWKERNGPYKTGKFCHIYRPLIRDARGRKVWGLLDIVGHQMTITIPEDWLADAEYPVVVDPVVGTQTRGALKTIDWYGEEDPVDFYLELQMGFSRFTATSPISGTCTSYIYSYLNNDYSARAVLFSDSAGLPYARLSGNEQLVDLDRSTPAWVSSTFTLASTIPAGASFWYGYYTPGMVCTYYDAAGIFRRMNTDAYSNVPALYDDEWNEQTWPVLMSAYFNYSVAQALNRSMLDTVGLRETFGKKFAFKRTTVNAVKGTEGRILRKFVPRVCTGTSLITEKVSRIVAFKRFLNAALFSIRKSTHTVRCSRILTGAIGLASVLSRVKRVVIHFADFIGSIDVIAIRLEVWRILVSGAGMAGRFLMVQTLFRFCATGLAGVSTLVRSVGFFRFLASWYGVLENMLQRMILKKEELIIVSRVTREIEFKGYLV